jgi:hypothetical protein
MLKKTFIFLFFIFNLLTAQDYIALATKSEGDVVWERGEEKTDLKTGSKLINGDILVSKKDSYAAIKFIDGSSVVKLFANSNLRLNTNREDEHLNKHCFLEMGNLWTAVKQKTGIFEIETPTTVVSVQGTEFVVNVIEEGVTLVHALKGQVAVKSKFNDEEIILPADKTAKVAANEELQVRKTREDDISDDIKQETAVKNIKIELENEAGEKKTIKIEYED